MPAVVLGTTTFTSTAVAFSHSYVLQIDVETGDKYYQACVWADGKMQLGDWKRQAWKKHRGPSPAGSWWLITGTLPWKGCRLLGANGAPFVAHEQVTNKRVVHPCYSNGVKQRVHAAAEEDGKM